MEIVPGVHQVGIGYVNCFLIVEEELALIDAATRGSSGHIVESIERLGRSPSELTLICLTHYHSDHVGAAAELKGLTGAKVAAHRADVPFINGEAPFFKEARGLKRALLFPPPPVEVDVVLEDGDELRPLGGLAVVHTPGHTPGSICLYSPSRRIVFVGDALNNWGGRLSPPMRLVSRDMAEARRSAQRLAELDFDTMCFGHGRTVTGNAQAKAKRLVARL
ncbi:MAG: MBL fold metallo-hydrolase [Chloroflexota bacterium]|nr:MBL fold metallo-hydrolase [Chloroflexota bacterium]